MKKKFQYSVFLKFIALVICILSTIGAVGAVAVLALENNIPEESEIRKKLYETSARNYAMKAIRSCFDSDSGSVSDEVASDLEGAGLDYEIFKGHSKFKENPVVANDNMVDYSAEFEGADYTYSVSTSYSPEYDTSSIWGAMNHTNSYEFIDDGYDAIESIYYSKSNKTFCIYTSCDEYFIAPEIDICENKKINHYKYSDGSYRNAETNGQINSDENTWDYVVIYDSEGLSITSVSKEKMDSDLGYYINALPYELVEGIGRGKIVDTGFTYSDDFESVKSTEKMPEEANYYTIFLMKHKSNSSNKNNLFSQADEMVDLFFAIAQFAVIIELVSAFLFLLSVIYLIYACGRSSKDGEIRITWFDRVPFLITFTLVVIVFIMAGEALIASVQVFNNYKLIIFVGLQLAVAVLFVCYCFIGSIITKLKGKCFWRYTIVYLLLKPFCYIIRLARENMSVFFRMLVIIGLLFLIYIGTGFTALSIDDGAMAIWILGTAIVLVAMFFFAAHQFTVLKAGSERISKGDLDNPVDLNKLVGEFKEHGKDINSIGQSIENAVSDKLKSERFKTELITNVSHDIKTPLTSIINYVDLIKKGDYTTEDFVEYVDVLDRQSNRLKKLIEDLMEASKASSGSLEVALEKFDATIMLTQVAGEFESRMQDNNLSLVMNMPEAPVELVADGRHLWRIFDNLLSNICKYALPGTRVYIDMIADEAKIYMIFKNTSAQQLNISSEELMERFVRGDSSRNTEGNGLGLSIATSLVSLINGEMKIDIDGDLFKVTLVFDRVYAQNIQNEPGVN